MNLWLFGLLYVGAAFGFYTYLIATAQVMPSEIAEAVEREEIESLSAPSHAHRPRSHAA